MFSDTVISVLKESGWSPERKVPTIFWIKQLESEGFTMLPYAMGILENFGDLVIRPPKLLSNVYIPEVLRFDPVLAASGDFERVEYWQKRFHVKLSPIAEVGAAMLLLAGDGRVFSSWDGMLWLDGTSFEDAINNTLIVANREPVVFARMTN